VSADQEEVHVKSPGMGGERRQPRERGKYDKQVAEEIVEARQRLGLRSKIRPSQKRIKESLFALDK
jgi:hypothetical protein